MKRGRAWESPFYRVIGTVLREAISKEARCICFLCGEESQEDGQVLLDEKFSERIPSWAWTPLAGALYSFRAVAREKHWFGNFNLARRGSMRGWEVTPALGQGRNLRLELAELVDEVAENTSFLLRV